MKRYTYRLLCLTAFASIVLSLPASGHHSIAMYDYTIDISVSGVVTEFEWRNPHCWLHVMIEDESGTSAVWTFEGNSTGQLTRVGWSSDVVQPGDEVTVIIHPLRDGTRGGAIAALELADGRVFRAGGAPVDPIYGREGAPSP